MTAGDVTPPSPEHVGDAMTIIVKRGPDGKPIVDLHITDSSGIGAIIESNRKREGDGP